MKGTIRTWAISATLLGALTLGSTVPAQAQWGNTAYGDRQPNSYRQEMTSGREHGNERNGYDARRDYDRRGYEARRDYDRRDYDGRRDDAYRSGYRGDAFGDDRGPGYASYGYYEAPSHAGQAAAIIGGSAVAGAVIGGAAGHGQGAAVGAVMGAVAGVIADQAVRHHEHNEYWR